MAPLLIKEVNIKICCVTFELVGNFFRRDELNEPKIHLFIMNFK